MSSQFNSVRADHFVQTIREINNEYNDLSSYFRESNNNISSRSKKFLTRIGKENPSPLQYGIFTRYYPENSQPIAFVLNNPRSTDGEGDFPSIEHLRYAQVLSDLEGTGDISNEVIENLAKISAEDYVNYVNKKYVLYIFDRLAYITNSTELSSFGSLWNGDVEDYRQPVLNSWSDYLYNPPEEEIPASKIKRKSGFCPPTPEKVIEEYECEFANQDHITTNVDIKEKLYNDIYITNRNNRGTTTGSAKNIDNEHRRTREELKKLNPEIILAFGDGNKPFDEVETETRYSRKLPENNDNMKGIFDKAGTIRVWENDKYIITLPHLDNRNWPIYNSEEQIFTHGGNVTKNWESEQNKKGKIKESFYAEINKSFIELGELI